MMMNLSKNIWILGDVHAEFSRLNRFLAEKRPAMVICCGDFGYWPHGGEGGNYIDLIKNESAGAKVYWCDGNHENFDLLELAIKDKPFGPVELRKDIFYMPRGSSLTLEDGRNILFMGGAYSIDKYLRTPGYDWFPQETIKEKDMDNLPDIQVDIVVSHTCPTACIAPILQGQGNSYSENRLAKAETGDPSTHYLDGVLERYQPPLWYFAHWHKFAQGDLALDHGRKCHWTCLNIFGHSQGQMQLSV